MWANVLIMSMIPAAVVNSYASHIISKWISLSSIISCAHQSQRTQQVIHLQVLLLVQSTVEPEAKRQGSQHWEQNANGNETASVGVCHDESAWNEVEILVHLHTITKNFHGTYEMRASVRAGEERSVGSIYVLKSLPVQ